MDLLSSHLLLAVKDEACNRDVLGKQQKPLLDALLKLIDEAKDNSTIIESITTTLKNGAQYLLPKPEERVEMLLSLLPKSSEDLNKASYGQVGFDFRPAFYCVRLLLTRRNKTLYN